jgi:hypothetical protein
MNTLVLSRCRRCGLLVETANPTAIVTVREAVEHRATVGIHECADGATGVTDIVGTGPGRPREASQS